MLEQLLDGMLMVRPEERMTPSEMHRHPFLRHATEPVSHERKKKFVLTGEG
jgi:serine/threonine protein kinase